MVYLWLLLIYSDSETMGTSKEAVSAILFYPTTAAEHLVAAERGIAWFLRCFLAADIGC
jgi:hypothetical protein